jgi:hypothetical protein
MPVRVVYEQEKERIQHKQLFPDRGSELGSKWKIILKKGRVEMSWSLRAVRTFENTVVKYQHYKK